MDANVLRLYADQEKSKRLYESIGAIRELCTMSRLGLFEKEDESRITQVYPLNSLINHLSVIRDNDPRFLDPIICENIDDPSSCPGIWPKEFMRTKKQLSNYRNNGEDCLGDSQTISEFTCSDTVATIFGFLSGTGESKKPVVVERNYTVKVNLANKTAIVIENKNERIRLISDQVSDDLIRIKDLSVSAEWRLNLSDLSIQYSDAYVLGDGSLGETAESLG